jgi:hypothetical protein
MKKPLIIGIVVLTSLLIIALWVYLLMYGKPEQGADIFTRFGGTNAEVAVSETSPNENVTNEEATLQAQKRLRQLSLRPIAGASFTGTGILYAEQGTGHLYHIDLTTGNETLVSGTTIPGAQSAVFAPLGTYVAITTTNAAESNTVVSKVTLEGGNGTLSGVSLPANASHISFSNATGTLFYTREEIDGTTAYSYAIETQKGTQLFKVPLKDIRVLWGKQPYIYTTPTRTQIGYIYKVEQNRLSYVTSGGTGLSALLYDGGILVSALSSSGPTLFTYILNSKGERNEMPLPLLPEKCITGKAEVGTLYCGIPSENLFLSFPDSWYKGAVSYTDSLWKVNPDKREATNVIDLLTESGREIDIRSMGTNGAGDKIFMINKNDNMLWLLDTTIP